MANTRTPRLRDQVHAVIRTKHYSIQPTGAGFDATLIFTSCATPGYDGTESCDYPDLAGNSGGRTRGNGEYLGSLGTNDAGFSHGFAIQE